MYASLLFVGRLARPIETNGKESLHKGQIEDRSVRNDLMKFELNNQQ